MALDRSAVASSQPPEKSGPPDVALDVSSGFDSIGNKSTPPHVVEDHDGTPAPASQGFLSGKGLN